MPKISQISNVELAESLSKLVGQRVSVGPCDVIYEDAAARIVFADQTKLNCTYWRLVNEKNTGFSSFDQDQQYGSPEKINALAKLKDALSEATVIDVRLLIDKGDLIFLFSSGDQLEVFRFTGYEVWDILFPDGTGQYSNYI